MSNKRQRNRGFLLTEVGKLKLEAAKQKAEKLNNHGKRYTVEQLAQIAGLDLSTITRIFDRFTRTDRRTLETLFKAFNLKLEASDIYKPKLKANPKLDTSNLPIYCPANSNNIYGRERELKELREYINKEQIITLYGAAGVGKTALAVELVESVKDSFKYICWRSLGSEDSRAEVAIAILNSFSVETDKQDFESLVAQLIIFLQQQRCLIVFDNVEQVRNRQTIAFFNYLRTATHKSYIVLISSRKLDPVLFNRPSSFLIDNICFIAAKKLLREYLPCTDDNALERLVQKYDGHPLSLHLAANTILDIFNGDVQKFIDNKATSLAEIAKILELQVKEFSRAQKIILYWLTINIDPISLDALEKDTGKLISVEEIIQCLQNLKNCLLIKNIKDKLALQPFLQPYLINLLIQQICQQVAGEKNELLTTNALFKATASDFIQRQQVETILKPIADRLLAELGRDRLLAIFANLLNRQRQHTPRKSGYLAGNIFNLLCYLETDLDRWNFSNLSVWQADGRGMNLTNCNFAFADLSQSRFTEDFGETLSLAISPDKKRLAAGDTNGQIRLWSLSDRRQQQTLRGHCAWTQMVAYSRDGRALASCSSDRTIRLWDLASGSCNGILKSDGGRVRAIAFTPDGHLASGGDDPIIKLWHLDTKTVRQTLVGHTDKIRSIIINLDGGLISSSDDGSIRFWQDGKCRQTIEAHPEAVWTIAASSDSLSSDSLIASGSVDNTVKLWDSNGSHLATFEHQGTVSRVAFNADGTLLASASYDRTVRIWDVATRRQLKLLPHHDWVQSLVFNEQNQHLITSSRDRKILSWNLNTGELETTIDSFSNGVWAIAVSSDNQQIASANDEPSIQLWNPIDNKIERVLRGHSKSIWSVAYSHDNRFLATASDDCTIRIWQKFTGKLCRTIKGDRWFWSVAFHSHDSSVLASAGTNCKIEFWNINTGKVTKTLNGHTEIIRHLAFDSQGKYLASCGLDSTARVWHTNTGECVSILHHPSPVSSVAFSNQQSILATGSDDNIVRLWNIKTGQMLQSLSGHTEWVQSVAFSPDGELLASGSHDGTIKLWQVKQKQLYATLTHGGWVRAIAFRTCPTTDKLQLVSGSQNGTIKLWDVNSKNLIKTLSSPQPYSQTNITGVTGVSALEKETLMALGAIATNISTIDNVVYLRFQSRKSI